MNVKAMFIKYFIPVIMIFFVARNLILVETQYMGSWMGGGMRMFGTIDKMLFRVSGFVVESNSLEYFVNLRNVGQFKGYDVEARILPSSTRLNRILSEVKQKKWCLDKETGMIDLKNGASPCNQDISIDNIKRFEVYRTHYDPITRRVSLSLINSVKNQ